MILEAVMLCVISYCYDGDTCRCRVDGASKDVKIRLVGIDTPEMKSWKCPPQKFAREAGDALNEFVQGKQVEVHSDGYDRYGRLLGTIYYDFEDINALMVELGLAEVYRGFDTYRDHPYYPLEEYARSVDKGMWILGDDYESPRAYRKRCF